MCDDHNDARCSLSTLACFPQASMTDTLNSPRFCAAFDRSSYPICTSSLNTYLDGNIHAGNWMQRGRSLPLRRVIYLLSPRVILENYDGFVAIASRSTTTAAHERTARLLFRRVEIRTSRTEFPAAPNYNTHRPHLLLYFVLFLVRWVGPLVSIE